MNKLCFSDRLRILREHTLRRADETAERIYLDPPFHSKRDYSVLLTISKGHESDAHLRTSKDSRDWSEEGEREFLEFEHSPSTDGSELMQALRRFPKRTT